MSALRELVVSIDFNQIDTARLTQLDNTINDIESALQQTGAQIDSVTTATNELGSNGSSALDELAGSAEGAEDSVGGMNDTAGKGSGIMGTLATAGAAAFAAISAAAVAATVAIGNFNADMEESFDRLEAKTATTGAELEALKQTSKDVWADGFGEDLREVTDQVAIMNGLFKDLSREGMTEAGKGISTIVDLWDQDFNEVARAVAVLQRNFDGLSATEGLDAIAWGFQNGLNFSDELLDTLREYSPQFQEMGMSLGQMMNVLAAGADAGAWNLDKVGDAIKESHLRMGDLATTTTDTYKALGFNAEKYVSLISKGGDAGNKAFQEIVSALQGVEDETLRNQYSIALFGTQYEDLREKVIFAMAEATTATADYKNSTKDAADAAYSNFNHAFEEIKRQGTLVFSEAFGGENGTLTNLANMVLEEMPAFAAAVDMFAGYIKTAFEGVAAWAVENKDSIMGVLTGIGDFFTGVWSIIQGAWFLIGPLLMETLPNALSFIMDYSSLVLGLIGGAFKALGQLLTGDFSGAWETMKETGRAALDGLVNLVESGLTFLWGLFDTTAGRIIEAFTGIDLTEIGANVIQGLTKGMSNALDSAVTMAKNVASNIVTATKKAFGVNSPSRLMADEVGQHLPTGIAMGAERSQDKAVKSMEGITEVIAGGSSSVAAQSGGGGTTNHMTFHINASGNNDQEVGKKVREEISGLFRELGIQFA